MKRTIKPRRAGTKRLAAGRKPTPKNRPRRPAKAGKAGKAETNGKHDKTMNDTAISAAEAAVAGSLNGTAAGSLNLNPLMTIDEVAALLGMHRDTVIAHYGAGKMPKPLKISHRNVKFRRADILNWIRLGCKSARTFDSQMEAERRAGR